MSHGEGAEDLRDELLLLAPGERLGPRFHSEALIDLLLKDSEALQTVAPESSVFWADLAWELAEAMRDKRCLGDDAKARAARLKGNALRLDGDLEAAERAFAAGLLHLADTSPERPHFCRTLGLLRWAQDRLDEGVSLLQHSACLFDDQGREGEDAVSLSLVGLLWSETSKPLRSLGPLHHAALLGGAPHHAWLNQRCELLRAAHLGEVGAFPQGRAVLRQAMERYAQVPGEEETLVSFRLEGAARARLGELGEAENLLEGVRRKQLIRRRVPELALTSLALGALWATMGREREIGSLAEETRGASFEPEEGGVFAVEALETLQREVGQGIRPWEAAARASAELLRLCRRFEVRLEPIPFP